MFNKSKPDLFDLIPNIKKSRDEIVEKIKTQSFHQVNMTIRDVEKLIPTIYKHINDKFRWRICEHMKTMCVYDKEHDFRVLTRVSDSSVKQGTARVSVDVTFDDLDNPIFTFTIVLSGSLLFGSEEIKMSYSENKFGEEIYNFLLASEYKNDTGFVLKDYRANNTFTHITIECKK